MNLWSEEQKRGRNKGKKKLIVLAIEIVDTGVGRGRANAEVIKQSSAKELGAFMTKHISKGAKVITDKWRGYSPLKKVYTKL
jgi:hypothetical protein